MKDGNEVESHVPPPPSRWVLDEKGNVIGNWLSRIKEDWQEVRCAPANLWSEPEVMLVAAAQCEDALEYATLELRADHTFMDQAVTCNPMSLKYASDEIRGDRDLVLKVLPCSWGEALQYASPGLRNDPHVVMQAVKWSSGEAFRHAGESIRSSEDFVSEAVIRGSAVLKYVSESLRSSHGFVLHACQWDPKALQYAAEARRNDVDFLLEVLEWSSGRALEFTPMSLRESPEFMAQVSRWPVALKYASDQLRSDFNFVLEAVRRTNGEAWEYAPEMFRNDRPLTLKAVKCCGLALKHAEHFQSDRDLVREAVQHSPEALRYAAKEIRQDREFALEAVQLDWQALRYVDFVLRADRDVVFQAVKQSWSAVQYADPRMRLERTFMLEALKWQMVLHMAPRELAVHSCPALAAAVRCSNGRAVGMPADYAKAQEYMSKHYQIDLQFMLQAFEWGKTALNLLPPLPPGSDLALVMQATAESWIALKCASHLIADREALLETIAFTAGQAIMDCPEELQNDRYFVFEAVKKSWQTLQYVGEQFRADRTIVREAVHRSWGQALEFAAHELRSDWGFALEAVTLNALALEHVAAELRTDREFVVEAVRMNSMALRYAAVGFRTDPRIVEEADHSFKQLQLRLSEYEELEEDMETEQGNSF